MVRTGLFKKVFVLAALLLGVGVSSGCGSSSSSESEQCQTAMTCGSYTLSACCTSSQCRYKSSNGKEFACVGTNCDSAANSAASWCLSQ